MTATFRLMLGEASFLARSEPGAPQTFDKLCARLPFEGQILHARWSGEAAWARLGEPLDLATENATAYPCPGQLLLYPGGISEPELLLPYGPCAFASCAGSLAGNHFATVTGSLPLLRMICESTLVRGAVYFKISLEA